MEICVDISNIILETERLLLRSFNEGDLEDLFTYASVPGIGEMAGWPHHDSIETSKRILKSFIEGKEVFALYHKNDRKVIGSLGLHSSWASKDERYKDLKVKEIGYVLSKDYWGRGLVPEAVNAVIAYCFDTLGAEALTCCHFLTNNQSRRVIEKCGFSFVKQSVYYSKQLEQEFDEKKYILHKEQWKKSSV
ncbi:MAG: GNAT family N-acetyltransferase [Eubacteriales bacterium]|nr:GNAT family N-acetyltransferase [Eubacteriales bacterium]